MKGMGKHQILHSIIGPHWTWRTRCRVPGKANVADPLAVGTFPSPRLRGWRTVRSPHKAILLTFKVLFRPPRVRRIPCLHETRSSTAGSNFDGIVQLHNWDLKTEARLADVAWFCVRSACLLCRRNLQKHRPTTERIEEEGSASRCMQNFFVETLFQQRSLGPKWYCWAAHKCA